MGVILQMIPRSATAESGPARPVTRAGKIHTIANYMVINAEAEATMALEAGIDPAYKNATHEQQLAMQAAMAADIVEEAARIAREEADVMKPALPLILQD